MADAGTPEGREVVPSWFRVPVAETRQLGRFERQVAAGIITPAEFGQMATDWLVLLTPPDLSQYCRSLSPALAKAVLAWVGAVLATPDGLLHSHGHIPLGLKTPERVAWVARWMEPRYRSLLAAVEWSVVANGYRGAVKESRTEPHAVPDADR